MCFCYVLDRVLIICVKLAVFTVSMNEIKSSMCPAFTKASKGDRVVTLMVSVSAIPS